MNIWAFIISIIIWFLFILHWIFGSIPKKRIFEIFAGCSISLCLTLTIFGLFGWYQNVKSYNLQIIGVILIIITIILAIFSLISLKRKGKPKIGVEDTTSFINTTIFSIIRHPLYLGFILWGGSQILIIQSYASIVLGSLAILFTYLAAVNEDEYNISKFGEKYKEYMKKIPRLNFLLGIVLYLKRKK
jgi:protein-S-isoprenylcysteine O-methyltransferase Ste14